MSAALHVVADERAEWLERRRTGIGASDAAAVAGFSPFDTPTSIYLKKIGFLREREEEEDWQRMGRVLEPVIAGLFEEETGHAVGFPQLEVAHSERPWQRATLDGIVLIDGTPAGPFECKSASRWNREWTDEPPDYYQAQLLHQMIVLGADRGWLAALIDGRRFRWWEVQRSDLDAQLLTSVEAAFWTRVIERRPPPVDGSERTNEALRAAHGLTGEKRELADDEAALVDALRTARADRLAAEKAETKAENHLLALLAGAGTAIHRGQTVLRWSQYEQRRADVDALKAQGVAIPMKTIPCRKLVLPAPKEQ